MHTASLHLNGADRVRYFAPIAFCAFLAALCLALIVTSAFLTTVRDALRSLRFVTVPTRLSPLASFEAVRQLAQESDWHIVEALPGARIEARTSDSMLHHGEIVAVEFKPHEVLIASVTDPSVGFSLVGQRRCKRNIALVRRAVTDAAEND
jgi:hypothetical protein